MGREKRLVYVSEDIINEIQQITRRKGIFISKFVEESLKQAIRLENLGYGIEETAEILEAVRVLRALGGVFTPQEILECLVGNSCRSREEILKKWFEAGVLYGKYMKEKFRNPLSKLRRFLETVRWDLNEVDVNDEGGTIKLRCMSSTHTPYLTETLAKFVEGIAIGLGHHVLRSEVVKGLIIMELAPASSRSPDSRASCG